MAVDHEGSIYVAGNTIQDLVSGSGWLSRFILLKYASNGEYLWSYRFDGPSLASIMSPKYYSILLKIS